MKKWLWLAWLSGIVTVGMAAEAWSRRMTPEEFKAAGLDKLSPAELARLDALVGKYGGAGGESEIPAARPSTAQVQVRQAEIDAAATKQAAARVAEAEARTRKAEQEAAAAREAAQTAKAEQKKAEEGFFAKAKKVIISPGTKVEVAAVEGEIDGDFTGWDAMTAWRLKDGTMWRVDNKPPAYSTKRMPNPRVKIRPAAVGGYWMDFVDLDLQVRVRQLK